MSAAEGSPDPDGNAAADPTDEAPGLSPKDRVVADGEPRGRATPEPPARDAVAGLLARPRTQSPAPPEAPAKGDQRELVRNKVGDSAKHLRRKRAQSGLPNTATNRTPRLPCTINPAAPESPGAIRDSYVHSRRGR
jgi:hypothetical protein